MAERQKAGTTKRRKPKTLQLAVQNGGSSAEFYPSFYNTERQATRAIEGHRRASYDGFGPYAVPVAGWDGDQALIREMDVLDLIQEALRGSHH